MQCPSCGRSDSLRYDKGGIYRCQAVVGEEEYNDDDGWTTRAVYCNGTVDTVAGGGGSLLDRAEEAKRRQAIDDQRAAERERQGQLEEQRARSAIVEFLEVMRRKGNPGVTTQKRHRDFTSVQWQTYGLRGRKRRRVEVPVIGPTVTGWRFKAKPDRRFASISSEYSWFLTVDGELLCLEDWETGSWNTRDKIAYGDPGDAEWFVEALAELLARHRVV